MHSCHLIVLPHSAPESTEARGSPRAADARPAREPGAAAPRLVHSAPAGTADFDFLHGQWLVENRRAAEPFDPASAWLAFDSILGCRPLAESGHLEESASDDGAASVLRLFDSHHRRWTVHRILAEGALCPPLTGRFIDGVGTFVGEQSTHGERVLVRETWGFRSGKPRWEQSFSLDGGETWTVHWIRDLIRVNWPQ